ncbi:EpsG family protein [Marinospirillum sp.]|uniref:EpsG family protein n=1 Tax=Marinospirillum sp. TaxID=2183934 RepID=UPI00384F4720
MSIRFYSAFVFLFSLLLAAVMWLANDTAKDRSNYISHFNDPFGGRLEIGFKYYMNAFNMAGFSAEISIVITCVVIYLFFAVVWRKIIGFNWFITLLILNIVVFGVFNYYLGTSIRMGLAISFALFCSFMYLEGKKSYFYFLLLTPLIHYGALLYVLIFLWVYLFRSRSFLFHAVFVVLGTIFLLILFDFILPYIGLSSYYIQYFNSDFGRTERLFPFTMAYSLSLIMVIIFSSNEARRISPFLYYLSIYTVPFLVFIVFTGNPLFAKMLMPLVFIKSAFLVLIYRDLIYDSKASSLVVAALLMFNAFSVYYALVMYRLI